MEKVEVKSISTTHSDYKQVQATSSLLSSKTSKLETSTPQVKPQTQLLKYNETVAPSAANNIKQLPGHLTPFLKTSHTHPL